MKVFLMPHLQAVVQPLTGQNRDFTSNLTFNTLFPEKPELNV